MKDANRKIAAYIGNWGRPSPDGLGISLCYFNPENGELLLQERALPEVHTGHICIDPSRNVLYCADEQRTNPDFIHFGGGRVFAAAIGLGGRLTELNHEYSFAPQPSYVTVDQSRKYLVLTNHSGGDPITVAERDASGKYVPVLHYSDASIVLYALKDNGEIGEVLDIFKVEGHGVLPKQPMPFLHSVVQSKNTGLFFVCDKGCNKVYAFRIRGGKLEKCGEYTDTAGSSPRYSLIVESKNLLILNHEGTSEITTLRFDQNGNMEFADSVDSLPGVVSPEKKEASDIKMSRDGKRIYNISRGVNIVSVLEFDDTGRIQVKQLRHFEATTFCGGGARGCALSPDEKYFYICVADDGDVHRFDIREDGTLGETDTVMNFGNPSNITFYPDIP